MLTLFPCKVSNGNNTHPHDWWFCVDSTHFSSIFPSAQTPLITDACQTVRLNLRMTIPDAFLQPTAYKPIAYSLANSLQ
jgi:hypothetical protein